MTELQLLRDPNIEPNAERIAAGLGTASVAYTEFLGRLEAHDISLAWRYYNDGKAWLGKGLYTWVTKRGTHKEITTLWLSVWEGFFRIAIYIPEKHRAAALALPLSAEVRKMVEDAQQMGKLKFFPLILDLRSSERFEDVLALLDFKKALK